uniref:DNA pilot protein n=1 Tax=Dulem virus 222 TaxID=3145699 RepID=A0AAU8B431_9VIRU
MGAFLSALSNIGAGANSMGQVASTGGGILGLFGIGNRKRAKRQLENQIKLNEAANESNYRWGEKAAENAFKRQMEAYERSYEDQSYAAMRKQMEEAGLSVGLMYGGSGSGGGSGFMTQAPMGQAHGANAGEADSPAEQWAMRANQIEMGLQLENLKKQGNVLDTQRDKNAADAEKAQEEAETERELRPGKKKQLFYEGRNEYVDNLRKMFEDMDSESERWSLDAYDDFYGDHSITSKRLPTKKESADIIKVLAESEEKKGQAENARALAELNTEAKKYLFTNALANLIQASAAEMSGQAALVNAKTNQAAQVLRELSLKYEYGVEGTPKFWIDVAIRGLSAIAAGVGAATAAGRIGKLLDKAGNRISRTTTQRYDKRGHPMGSSETWHETFDRSIGNAGKQ